MKSSEAWAPGEARERCHSYSYRLEDSVLNRGRDLLAMWDSYNSAENPLRHVSGPDGKAVAINLMMSACLHEAMLTICAVLDVRRNTRPLRTSNLVSFPVVAELMQVDDFKNEDLDADDAAGKRLARARFLSRVQALNEPPVVETLTRLRDFRNDFLAHALDQQSMRTPPMLGDIHALMDQACILSGDCQLALFGKRVTWEYELVTARESVDAIWRVIARASS